MLGFSMFFCTLALSNPKGAYECIGKKRLELATAIAKRKLCAFTKLTGACDEGLTLFHDPAASD